MPEHSMLRFIALLLVVVVTGGSSPAPAAGDDKGTTFTEVCWSELRFEASKLFMTARADLRIRSIARVRAQRRLRHAPEGAEVPLDSAVVHRLTMASDLPFGRNELVDVLLDPSSGAALQSQKEVSGSKQYWKLRRYAAEGYFQWRAEPRSKEKKLKRREWTKRSKGLVRWDHSPTPSLVVTDSYALLYLISAARLDLEEGRTLRVAIFSKGKLVEIELVARELVTRKVDFKEVRGDSKQTRKGKIQVRRVIGTGKPIAGGDKKGDDVDLGFLGMQGDLEVFLEYGTGIPVEVNGKAKTIGKLTVSLQQVKRR